MGWQKSKYQLKNVWPLHIDCVQIIQIFQNKKSYLWDSINFNKRAIDFDFVSVHGSVSDAGMCQILKIWGGGGRTVIWGAVATGGAFWSAKICLPLWHLPVKNFGIFNFLVE